MNHFPKLLSSQIAFDIAQTMLEGFDRHYRVFRDAAIKAKTLFETDDWHALQQLARERIASYDDRVDECVMRLEDEYDAENIDAEIWQQIKLHYIGLLTSHHQPECAETFFNSVSSKILHRSYFHNDFIFVRPAVSTEYIENDEPAAKPTYRAYYPAKDGLAATLERIVTNFQLNAPFEDLGRDVQCVMQSMAEVSATSRRRRISRSRCCRRCSFATRARTSSGGSSTATASCRSRCPCAIRSRACSHSMPCCSREQLLIIFSFAHSYFLVDMEVPSAYVQFLRSIMPGKPHAEIYTSLGLQKQGKNLFYRDLLHHLSHSSDQFSIAPGIKGMVMLVFDAAVVSVRVQDDQGLLPAAEGHDAREDQGQVPARQAARPGGPHGRHARVLERRVADRAPRSTR